jgi:hypothetical protein
LEVTVAKQLFKECDSLIITELKLKRIGSVEDVDGEPKFVYRTEAIITADAISDDGTILKQVHEKLPVGEDNQNSWDADMLDSDVREVASVMKNKLKDFVDSYTK